MAHINFCGISAVAVVVFSILAQITDSQFNINYTADSFYMNGRPFRYVSGSLHYFRIPKEYWRDRLRKARAAGLNAISTYVEWSQHESKPGVFDFGGDLDLVHFIKLAQEEKLYVILRPGPYICAERDMGGLPFWLMNKHPDVYLRTRDQKYTKYVERWMDALLTKMSPLLYGNGGPIILVQVENEYGSYQACDMEYLVWLRNLFEKYIRNKVVLFTTDGAGSSFLTCGKIPGVYATIDFGASSDVDKAIATQRQFEPRGPLVNSEYYTGWLTHWGEKMASTNTSLILKTMREMLERGMNINLYMFHGGTNFGFTAGANFDKTYIPDITSYDYDAPVSEAGDLTEKYFAIRNLIHEYFPPTEVVQVSTADKDEYGEIELTAVGSLLSSKVKKLLGVTRRSERPMSFEAMNQNFGYALYETIIDIDEPIQYLKISTINDIGNVYVNGRYRGTFSREYKVNWMPLREIRSRDTLSVVVENLGRINFGPYLNDKKGILSSVNLGSKELLSWNITSFELGSVRPLESCYSPYGPEDDCLNGGGFTFYVGTFRVPDNAIVSDSNHLLDTYLDVSHLTKGIVFVNDFNLGRYWSSRGPQYTLYVPGIRLKPSPQENVIVVMDEYISSPNIKVKFTKNPIFRYQ